MNEIHKNASYPDSNSSEVALSLSLDVLEMTLVYNILITLINISRLNWRVLQFKRFSDAVWNSACIENRDDSAETECSDSASSDSEAI